jgi:AraC-like DNA-binding protein
MIAFRVLNFVIDNERVEERMLSPEIEKSIQYIENNLFEPLDLPHLADYVFLSLSHFKARFKREVGLAPGEYVMRRKIRKACDLLLEGISITNTAYALCFSSAQYFSRVFKQYNAISPSQYLQQTKAAPDEGLSGT